MACVGDTRNSLVLLWMWNSCASTREAEIRSSSPDNKPQECYLTLLELSLPKFITGSRYLVDSVTSSLIGRQFLHAIFFFSCRDYFGLLCYFHVPELLELIAEAVPTHARQKLQSQVPDQFVYWTCHTLALKVREVRVVAGRPCSWWLYMSLHSNGPPPHLDIFSCAFTPFTAALPRCFSKSLQLVKRNKATKDLHLRFCLFWEKLIFVGE